MKKFSFTATNPLSHIRRGGTPNRLNKCVVNNSDAQNNEERLRSIITQVSKIDSVHNNRYLTQKSTPFSPISYPLLTPSMSIKKTLVVDLDETLVHSSFRPLNNAHFILPIEVENKIYSVYVSIRPGVDVFLEKLSKHYEIVLFTASSPKYADPLISKLDPYKYISSRLFREHCSIHNGSYVKDLSKLGRNLKNIIIVDNSYIAYSMQPENAFPATSWFEDDSDTELTKMIPFLEQLAYVDDVRKELSKIVIGGRVQYEKNITKIIKSSLGNEKPFEIANGSWSDRLKLAIVEMSKARQLQLNDIKVNKMKKPHNNDKNDIEYMRRTITNESNNNLFKKVRIKTNFSPIEIISKSLQLKLQSEPDTQDNIVSKSKDFSSTIKSFSPKKYNYAFDLRNSTNYSQIKKIPIIPQVNKYTAEEPTLTSRMLDQGTNRSKTLSRKINCLSKYNNSKTTRVYESYSRAYSSLAYSSDTHYTKEDKKIKPKLATLQK